MTDTALHPSIVALVSLAANIAQITPNRACARWTS